MRERKSNFGDKVGQNVKNQKESKKTFGYLNVPNNIKVLSFEEDTPRVDLDILPYEVTDVNHPDRDDKHEIAQPGTLWYRRPFKVHRKVGSANDSVICLRSVGKKCPICDYREKRAKEGAEKEELRELYGKPRSLYVVIPIGIPKFEEVPTIWDMSDRLFQDILNDELEASPEDRCFPDLEEGRTLTLKLKWKTLDKTTYPEVRSITFSERDPYKESILDEVPNLDEILKILPFDVIESKFFENDNEPVGGELHEVDEEKPIRKKSDEDNNDEIPVRRSVRSSSSEEKPTRTRREPEEEKPTRSVKKEEEKPTRSVKKEEEKPTRTSNRGECPHGHRFGIDTEDYKECDTCEVWGKCLDVKEGK
jgi:hypothetical protein